ncbi:hypothetical protein VPH35_101004 [Triticum aestivum]
MVAVSCWYLWWQRRLIVRDEEVQPPDRTAAAIHVLELNFVKATAKPANTPRVNHWRRPMSGSLALNVDASFFEIEHTGSCGAIVRDIGGMFVAASTSKLEHVADVVSAESAALVEGLKLALNIGCNSILVQMDNLMVVEVLNLNTGYSMISAPILDECRSLLSEFGKVSLEHCNRESNSVAHAPALRGRDDPLSVWLDSPPSFISLLLGDDISVV